MRMIKTAGLTAALLCLALVAGARPPRARSVATPIQPVKASEAEPKSTPAAAPRVLSSTVGYSIQRHRRTIERYAQSYRTQKALSMLRRYMERYPDDPWAYMQRSECRKMMLEFGAAVTDASKAIELGYDKVAGILQLAEIYRRADKPALARIYYEQAVDWAPWDAGVHFQTGKFYRRQEEFPRATEEFRTALRLKPGQPDYLYALAESLEAGGDLESALPHYERYMEVQYATPERYFQLGNLYMDKSRYAQAIACYEQLEQVVSDDFNTSMLLGRAYSGTGDYRKSLELFMRAYEKRPNDTRPLLAMAQICRLAKDYDRALQVYLRVLHLEPKNAEAHFGRARILSEQGRLEQAAQEAGRAAETRGNDAKIRALWAAILHAQGKAEEAEEQLKLARQQSDQAQRFYQEFLKRIPLPETPAGPVSDATREQSPSLK